MAKLVGLNKFTGKDGRQWCVLTLQSDCDERDIKNGHIGVKFEDVWLNQDFSFPGAKDLGKEVFISWGRSSAGRAIVQDISIVE